jgi:hypothetical protein
MSAPDTTESAPNTIKPCGSNNPTQEAPDRGDLPNFPSKALLLDPSAIWRQDPGDELRIADHVARAMAKVPI